MFFNTELLSTRDSGYGLLWLAATLGSKSKKLPRRSVLTADINQLCGLVSEPPEPLALRLSSNLMIGVVRLYKFKHEIFESDVSNCFTSLKKTLQDLHAINTTNTSLEMAQPNGVREDALTIVADPGMAMANEFDGILDMDWDSLFRVSEENVLGNDEDFCPDSITRDADPKQRPHSSQKKLHQLDESHDHLFSTSFLNSISGELGVENEGPSTSVNDILFDLDFGGDPDVGLGEEMERELEEAWNMKVDRKDEAAPALAPSGGYNFDEFHAPMDIDQGFEADLGGGGMDFADDAFNLGIEQEQEVYNGSILQGKEQNNGFGIGNSNLSDHNSAKGPFHTPPPRNVTPARSILSRRTADERQDGTAPQDPLDLEKQNTKTAGGAKKVRKKVTLVDPRTELTDDELMFQRKNYLQIMAKLRREAQAKKEQKEGKRRFEEELWAPPKEWRAPELIEWYNQRVVYPVKAREAAWREELEELQRPKKKRRLLEKEPAEQPDEERMPAQGAFAAGELDFGNKMDMDMGNMGDFVDDWGGMDALNDQLPAQQDLPPSGSRRSSDDPGQPRRASPHPPSLPGSSLLGRGSFNLSQGDQVSNSIFPWDNAGPSSSNAGLPGSLGMGGGNGSDLGFAGLSFDSSTVRFRKGSKTGSGKNSPMVPSRPPSLQGEGEEVDIGINEPMEFEASLGDVPGETQESESMVTLERNSFNFLGYARMHSASDSKPLFFSDIVPTESTSTRVAAEGFYHCLALATKDLIRLEQTEPYGPIKIQIK